MTAIAETNGTALAVPQYSKLAALTGFTPEQINLIRQTVASGANIVEVAWYLYNARRLGLEPTLDQIYLIKYGTNPADIVVGINGYRAQADSSGVYAGSDDPVFEYEDVGQPKRAPSKATVTVWKIVGGQRVPFTASTRWEEFYPGDGKVGEQYRKRPHNQLAVRAESHALRKGFPYQTGRLDTRESLPAAWVEAVQTDETVRRDPVRQAALAGKQEQLERDFIGDDAWDRVSDGPAEQAHPEAEGSPDSRPERLQALLAMAKKRGIKGGAPVPAAGEDALDVAIAFWDKRIEQHDLDAEAAKQSQA